MVFLNQKLAMKDAGCPLERHELTNQEWELLGLVQAERNNLQRHDMERKRKERDG